MIKVRNAFAALLAAAALAMWAAPPASADTVTGQGNASGHRYRGGVSSAGGVSYTAGVQVNRDASGAITRIRATGSVSKLSKVTKVQIDSITLGTATAAVTRKNTPVGSGRGLLATSRTAWRAVPAVSCTSYRARVNVSVRWRDGVLSKFSILSPLTKVCGRPGWSKGPDSVGGAPVPPFPTHLAGWHLKKSWTSLQNTFSFSWTEANGPNGSWFPSTMNGCDQQRFLVRWRPLNPSAPMDARFMDASGGGHSTVTGTAGWLDLDGCETPIFHLHRSNPHEVAGIAISVQQYTAVA